MDQPPRRAWLQLAGAGLFSLAVPSLVRAAEGDGDPLRLGIMPFNSPLALIKTHQPLRTFLQAYLKRPIEIFTAPDYLAFTRQLAQGSYDLAITAPHLMLAAGSSEGRSDYEPLLHYAARLESVLLVPRSARHPFVVDTLRGRRLAFPNRMTLVSMIGIRWLAERGLQMNRDYQLVEKPTHGAAIAAVAVGEAEAAVSTTTVMRQIPEDVRQRVVAVPTGVSLPHVFTVGHRRLGMRQLEQIRTALHAFAAVSPEGRAFFSETGYIGYESVTLSEMAMFRPYAAMIRSMLAGEM